MSNDRNGDGLFSNGTPSFYTKILAFTLKNLIAERLCDSPLFSLLPPSCITMNTAKATCPACKKVFTPHGLSQHIAKIHDSRCRRPVVAASPPQSFLQSSLNVQASSTLTANSALSEHPNLSFRSEYPSGHDGTFSDSPDFPLLDDGKLPLPRSKPYTKPTTGMIVDDASNSADNRANDQVTADGDDAPDTADTTDADVFEIITQTRFPDLDPITPDPGEFPSAELDSPPEDPPSNPLGSGSFDARPQVVVEPFPHGSPGARIDGMQSSSIYESTLGSLGGSVWAPFQSECDWRFAHWAKKHGPSSSALADLLKIPNVCPSPPFFNALLNVVKACGEARPLISYHESAQFNH